MNGLTRGWGYIGERHSVLLVSDEPHPWRQVVEVEGDCQIVIPQKQIFMTHTLLMDNPHFRSGDFINFDLLGFLGGRLVVITEIIHVDINHDLRLLFFLIIIITIIEAHFNLIVIAFFHLLLRRTLIFIIPDEFNILCFFGGAVFLRVSGFGAVDAEPSIIKLGM